MKHGNLNLWNMMYDPVADFTVFNLAIVRGQLAYKLLAVTPYFESRVVINVSVGYGIHPRSFLQVLESTELQFDPHLKEVVAKLEDMLQMCREWKRGCVLAVGWANTLTPNRHGNNTTKLKHSYICTTKKESEENFPVSGWITSNYTWWAAEKFKVLLLDSYDT